MKKSALESEAYFKQITDPDDLNILKDIMNGIEYKIIKQEHPEAMEAVSDVEDPEYTLDEMIDFNLTDIKIEAIVETEFQQFTDESTDKIPQSTAYDTLKPIPIKTKKSAPKKSNGTPKPATKKTAKSAASKEGEKYSRHGDSKIYACSIEGCGKVYHRPYMLKEHLEMHSGARSYKCDMCEKAYNTYHQLRSHKREIHNETIPCTCDLCGKTFKSKKCVYCHIRKVHLKLYNMRLVCELCGKELTSPKTLQVHMLYSHGGEKAFKCHICEKSFFTKGKLGQHIDALHGERPWGCEICGKHFSRRYKLGEHMKQIHKIQYVPKRFNCTLCDMNFDRTKLLQQHLRDKHEVAVEELN